MRKSIKFHTYKSIAFQNSVSEYRIRAYIDQCTQDDVFDFLSKHDIAINRLIEMLLDDTFAHRRAYDPSFPS